MLILLPWRGNCAARPARQLDFTAQSLETLYATLAAGFGASDYGRA